MAAAIDDRTVLVVASAPSYAHGVIDPVAPIAAAASAAGVRCHVDACIGGWVLPHLRATGPTGPAWTFAVEGVTSMSVDLHKYAYTPKGVSVLLHRSAELRRRSCSPARWPGYTMLNTTAQSTKSGGPLAAAWAVVHHIGDDRYPELARDARAATLALERAVDDIPELAVVAAPDSTLVSLETDDSCDVFTIADEMLDRGWFVQPQMALPRPPATLHLTLSAATAVACRTFDRGRPRRSRPRQHGRPDRQACARARRDGLGHRPGHPGRGDVRQHSSVRPAWPAATGSSSCRSGWPRQRAARRLPPRAARGPAPRRRSTASPARHDEGRAPCGARPCRAVSVTLRRG